METSSSTKNDILRIFYPTFVGVLIGLVLGGVLWIVVRTPRGQAVTLLPAPTPAPLVVDVAGAVVSPGVYELPEGSRVKDVIEAAGGFVAEADKAQLNMAEPITDGQKVSIPYIAGMEPTVAAVSALRTTNNGSGTSGTSDQPQIVDINTADASELETLPGIGPTLAQNIVDYRDTFGPFQSIEDIMNVDGIGDAIFAQIQDLITVSFQ